MLDNFLPLFIHPSRRCHFLPPAPNFDLSFTTRGGNVLVLPGILRPGEYPLLYLGGIPPARGRLLMYLNLKGICTSRSFFIRIPNIIFHLPVFFLPVIIFRRIRKFPRLPRSDPSPGDTPSFPPFVPLFRGNVLHHAERKSLHRLMNRCLSS